MVAASASSPASTEAGTGEPVAAASPAGNFQELLSCFFPLSLSPLWKENLASLV